MTAFAPRLLFVLLLLAGLVGAAGTANAHGGVVHFKAAERVEVTGPAHFDHHRVEIDALQSTGTNDPSMHGDDGCCACSGACHAFALTSVAAVWFPPANDMGDWRNLPAPPPQLLTSFDQPPKSFR